MSDAHGSHGHDAHGSSAHGHGHDAHGQDAHGHGGGHGHDDSPRRTPVPPFEPTPWAMIAIGIVIAGVVYFVGHQRDWASAVKSRPGATLPPAGASVTPSVQR